jgi:pullulanase/glycogen debranching enzyme
MILKPSAVSKSANKSVLEKLGNSDTTATTGLATTTEQIMLENAKAKREGNKLKKASEIKKEKNTYCHDFDINWFRWNLVRGESVNAQNAQTQSSSFVFL